MVVVEVLSSGERPSWRRVGDGSELEGAPSVVEAIGVGEVGVATCRLMCRPGGGGFSCLRGKAKVPRLGSCDGKGSRLAYCMCSGVLVYRTPA